MTTFTNSAMIDDLDPNDFAPASQGVPTGSGMEWYTNISPSGYLFQDGAEISRAGEPDLFAVIGTTFGAGDGVTTYNLPDKRARIAIGVGTGDDGTNPTETFNLADKGGFYKHQLTASEMASLTYTASLREDGNASPLSGDAEHGTGSVLDNMDITTNAGDQPHENKQPFLCVNFIIKT